MLDFSQVTSFEHRLRAAADTTKVEAEWKRDTAKTLADSIHPPEHTGALAASVRASDEGVEMLDYWQYPEYGTVNMAAQPFVRPAIARQTPASLQDLAKKTIEDLT